MFSCYAVPRDDKETELGSGDHEASPTAGKYTRIVLVPCCAWKYVPAVISSDADISKVPGCHFFMTDFFSQTLPKGLVSHELTAYLSVFILFFSSVNYGHIIKRM